MYTDGKTIKTATINITPSKTVTVSQKQISIGNRDSSFEVFGISNADIIITKAGKIAKIEKKTLFAIDEKLTNITKVTSNQGYTAIVTDETTLNVIGPDLRYNIAFYGKQITCIAVSLTFSTIVCGTVPDNIVFCSLFDATKVNTVSLGFTVTQVVITQSWGFVVATGKLEGKGKPTYHYKVFTINGREICSGDLKSEATCITTWCDDDGFDFAAVGCEDGKVLICEAFCGFGKTTNHPFANVNSLPRRLHSKVLNITYYKPLDCVVAATENGKINFIPLQ